APHGSHFRPPTKTHRINSHDNYPDAAGKGIEVIKLGEMSGQLFFIRDELGAYGAKIGQFESRSTDHFWS
ncbi:MAG: hypothetical protein CMI09_02600, partial [Oceanospirillaceae bacterium]|nr:hypothetical protein [Oceanospirillaceae bacterium]